MTATVSEELAGEGAEALIGANGLLAGGSMPALAGFPFYLVTYSPAQPNCCLRPSQV